MYKIIAVGEKAMSFLANGATPLRYKMVFGEDLMVAMTGITKEEKEQAECIDLVSRLAFVMNMQAIAKNKGELVKINKDEYVDWMEQFEPMDLARAASEILSIYLNDEKTTSTPKKEEGRLNEN